MQNITLPNITSFLKIFVYWGLLEWKSCDSHGVPKLWLCPCAKLKLHVLWSPNVQNITLLNTQCAPHCFTILVTMKLWKDWVAFVSLLSSRFEWTLKILNNIACNLNWNQISKLNWIFFFKKISSWIIIPFEISIQLNLVESNHFHN